MPVVNNANNNAIIGHYICWLLALRPVARLAVFVIDKFAVVHNDQHDGGLT